MSVILFILILLVLILVHEFGHFIVAKKSGIRVDEFGIGFPPRAVTLAKKGDTHYTLNWLPFGGFVKIFGETPDEAAFSGPDKERSFVNKPKYVQAAVLVAGVVFNWLLAWFLLSSIFMIGTEMALDENEAAHAKNLELLVSYVVPDSPAERAGLAPGDSILSLTSSDAELAVRTPTNASSFIDTHSDEVLTVTVFRNNETFSYTVKPETNVLPEEPERAVLGISMGLVGFVQYTNPLKALSEGGSLTLELTSFVWKGLMGFLGGLFTFTADFSEVAGPIGIVGIVGDAAAIGLTSLLFLTAIISINLAIINILPIPALDGGRLLFLIIEVFKGSPIRPRVANAIHSAFFVLLILLVLVVSYFDILRL